MPSRAGAHLTETHRLTQIRIGALTARQMTLLWPLLDLEHLDRTFPAWAAAVQNLVTVQRRLSAATAAAYYTAFRRTQLPAIPEFVPPVVDSIDRRAVARSMLVTGPISIKQAMNRGVTIATADTVANARSAGAAMRQTLNAGRETILNAVNTDTRAQGWERVISGDACDFCESLAGEVFSEANVDFAAHDHCACSAQPAF